MHIAAVNHRNTAALKDALSLVRSVFWDFDAPGYQDEAILAFEQYLSFASMHAQMQQNRLVMWAAYQSGQPIGVVAVQPPRHIGMLYVQKAYQNKGVATALLAEAARWLMADGTRLPVTVHVPPHVVDIFGALGFVLHGEPRSKAGVQFTPMACSPHALLLHAKTALEQG